MGDSIVRKTDKIEQGGGRSSVPGARIEHVTERVIMGRGKGAHTGTHRDEQRVRKGRQL